jgi:hypothetical protein
MDDEMESAFVNANMDFLDPTQLDMPSGSGAGGDFDDLFARATNSRPNGVAEPSKHYQDQHPLRQPPVMTASESPRNHLRQASIASTNSAAHSENPLTSTGYSAEDWMRPELSSVKEESPFNIEPSFPIDGGYSMDPDLETSNQAMDAAFDFESAASSPSPLKIENSQPPSSQKPTKSQIWSPSPVSAVPPQNSAAPPVSQFQHDLIGEHSNLDIQFRHMHPHLHFSLLE